MLITIPKWIHHHHSSGDENDRKTWDASYMKALLYSDNLIVCSTNISKENSKIINNISNSSLPLDNSSSEKNKIKETCLKKYGVEYAFQAEEIKDKIKQSCLEKYGVENVSQNSEIMDKISKKSY